MYHPIILHQLAKSIHEERMRDAEQTRLASIAKAASAAKPKKRFWQFMFRDEFTRKSIAKPIYFAHRKI